MADFSKVAKGFEEELSVLLRKKDPLCQETMKMLCKTIDISVFRHPSMTSQDAQRVYNTIIVPRTESLKDNIPYCEGQHRAIGCVTRVVNRIKADILDCIVGDL